MTELTTGNTQWDLVICIVLFNPFMVLAYFCLMHELYQRIKATKSGR